MPSSRTKTWGAGLIISPRKDGGTVQARKAGAFPSWPFRSGLKER